MPQMKNQQQNDGVNVTTTSERRKRLQQLIRDVGKYGSW